MVYDSTYVRLWDFWIGPKKPALFSVSFYMDPDRNWHMDGVLQSAERGFPCM